MKKKGECPTLCSVTGKNWAEEHSTIHTRGAEAKGGECLVDTPQSTISTHRNLRPRRKIWEQLPMRFRRPWPNGGLPWKNWSIFFPSPSHPFDKFQWSKRNDSMVFDFFKLFGRFLSSKWSKFERFHRYNPWEGKSHEKQFFCRNSVLKVYFPKHRAFYLTDFNGRKVMIT